MLFGMFVVILCIGVTCIILGKWKYGHTPYDICLLSIIGWIVSIFAAFAILISSICIIDSYSHAEALIASNNKRYEALVYQLENNLYDNDNDLGKKELYNEIKEWNEDLAYYQSIQDNFWFGIFYPNIYDQFKFVEFRE